MVEKMSAPQPQRLGAGQPERAALPWELSPASCVLLPRSVRQPPQSPARHHTEREWVRGERARARSSVQAVCATQPGSAPAAGAAGGQWAAGGGRASGAGEQPDTEDGADAQHRPAAPVSMLPARVARGRLLLQPSSL